MPLRKYDNNPCYKFFFFTGVATKVENHFLQKMRGPPGYLVEVILKCNVCDRLIVLSHMHTLHTALKFQLKVRPIRTSNNSRHASNNCSLDAKGTRISTELP